jgi:hypothetical protein
MAANQQSAPSKARAKAPFDDHEHFACWMMSDGRGALLRCGTPASLRASFKSTFEVRSARKAKMIPVSSVTTNVKDSSQVNTDLGESRNVRRPERLECLNRRHRHNDTANPSRIPRSTLSVSIAS